ncbi:hypothetical protein MRX96_018212 [Rhipicephalus microplus]
MVNWGIFRRLSATPEEGHFLQHVIDSAKVATVVSKTKPGGPDADLKQLQLQATEEGPSAVPSAVPRQKIGQLSGGWTPSVDATQTDDGSEAGRMSAVPSPALDAVQLRGGFCDHCSAGQPSFNLYWPCPSLWTSRSLLWRTSWRANLQQDHQGYQQRPSFLTD